MSGLFSGAGGLGLLIPLLFFAALYFFTIVPNQRKQKAWTEMLGSLKVGDKVTTTGGLRGIILQVRDDAITLRVQPDGVKLEFAKVAISAVTTGDEKA